MTFGGNWRNAIPGEASKSLQTLFAQQFKSNYWGAILGGKGIVGGPALANSANAMGAALLLRCVIRWRGAER